MPTGRVTYYTEDRGFGFIKPDDGGSDAKDWRVSFEVVNDDRRNKPRADRVRVI